MRTDVVEYCRKCQVCSEASRIRKYSPLEPMSSSGPFETISVDILELPQSGGYRYILALQDYFTRWLIAVPLVNQSSESIVNELTKIFSQHGFPNRIHSDQGRSFESFVFKKMCDAFGITKSRTTTYHPQGNGLVERANRSILSILRKIGNEDNWHIVLPIVTYAYNTAKHSVIKSAPFEALFGRAPKCLLLDQRNQYNEKIERFWGHRLNLAKIHDMIEEESIISCQSAKEYFDWKKNAEYSNYPKGTPVLRMIPTKSKISSSWEGGWIVEKDNGKTVTIKKKESDKTLVVSKDRVKRSYTIPEEVEEWNPPLNKCEDENDNIPNQVQNKRIRQPPKRYGNPLIWFPGERGRNVGSYYGYRDAS